MVFCSIPARKCVYKGGLGGMCLHMLVSVRSIDSLASPLSSSASMWMKPSGRGTGTNSEPYRISSSL